MIKKRIRNWWPIICIVISLMVACKSPDKICHTAEELMEQSVAAINSKNTKGYISLFDFDSMIEIYESAEKKDTSYTDLVNLVKFDEERLVKMYSMSYNIFIGTLEKIYDLDEWNFEIIDFELDTIFQEPEDFLERYILRMEDTKKDKWNMKIYISKYNNCYFHTIPIDVNYFGKGW